MPTIDLSKQTQDFKTAWYDLLSNLVSVDGNGSIDAVRFQLIGMVKVKIDEMMPEGEGVQFSVQDTANVSDPIDIYINALLDDSLVTLYQQAPKSKITGKACTNTANTRPDGTGYVILPDDYIRLKSFKMTVWDREVEEPITTDSPLYKRQRNTYLRGGKAKPVCVIKSKVIGETVKRVIEYYSIDTGDATTIEEFVYIPKVDAEDVEADLTDSLTWICAAKLLQIVGRREEAEKAWSMLQLSFQNLK